MAKRPPVVRQTPVNRKVPAESEVQETVLVTGMKGDSDPSPDQIEDFLMEADRLDEEGAGDDTGPSYGVNGKDPIWLWADEQALNNAG